MTQLALEGPNSWAPVEGLGQGDLKELADAVSGGWLMVFCAVVCNRSVAGCWPRAWLGWVGKDLVVKVLWSHGSLLRSTCFHLPIHVVPRP